MSRSIAVVYKHQLGVARVKQIVNEQFEAINSKYVDKIGSAAMHWTGDTADIQALALGQKVSAQVAVAEHDVAVTIDLPWLLAGFSGTIESILRSNIAAIDGGGQSKKSGPDARP